MFMDNFSWFAQLERTQTSYLLLAALTVTVLAAGILYQIGLIGWVLRGLGMIVRGGIRSGFLLWERLLAWASWPLFLAIVCGFLLVGGVAGGPLPALRVLFGLATLFMGAIACLAYMFIDLERNEVERGYKAVHNPLKGQVLALNLKRYGKQVRVPLLISATVALIGGFALFNQGLYETIGREWYKVADERREPIYADFLAYALTKILGVVDVLDLARSHHVLGAAFVRQAAWPASTLLAAFKLFFTMVLLDQIFASLRQGKLLAETIADFWSPHEPIHERARAALPIYGTLAIGPLLVSLRSVPSLTKEQRDQLPLILETIGPSIIPALVRHLHDPHEHVRAIVAAALGKLHALETVPSVAALAQDPSDVVRQSVVEALGNLGGSGPGHGRTKRGLARGHGSKGRGIGWFSGWKKRAAPARPSDPVELAVATLESALADESAPVRIQAARALGRIGPRAAAVAPRLIGLLKEADETIRCQAAQALGEVGGETGATVAALVELLKDASAPVKATAARALGALKKAAGLAVPSLVPLLQDRQESVRTAAAEAIALVGPLDQAATDTLVEGLDSPDNVVRAQTAQALGTIGAAAEEAAPALVEAMADSNDRVRAKAVEALGKIGEPAAATAVPGLVRALRDQDNWVSAKAAEALGQMGESDDATIAALVRSLGHLNPEVRRNAALALGNLGAAGAAAGTGRALEEAARDEDGGVRSQAILALGTIGCSTPASVKILMTGFQDADPLVRAAAVVSVGRWGEPNEAILSGLAPLLEDANDQVKVEAIKVLPRLAGATPAVIDGLCRRLLEDDNVPVQAHAALALGKLGPAATAAGGPLLHAAQTGEVSVREQAMRAIAMIQPPETTQAFAVGLKDASADIRTVASAGWMNAAVISEQAVPALIEALRDPEVQVRANAANALARLDAIPAAAIPLLIECTANAHDGLRMNAAMALKLAPADAVAEVMHHLVADPNSRVRLIAASSLLAEESSDATAGAVLVDALGDPALRVREAAMDLFESLNNEGAAILEGLQKRDGPDDGPGIAVGS
jgi:HEAT repeat protein